MWAESFDLSFPIFFRFPAGGHPAWTFHLIFFFCPNPYLCFCSVLQPSPFMLPFNPVFHKYMSPITTRSRLTKKLNLLYWWISIDHYVYSSTTHNRSMLFVVWGSLLFLSYSQIALIKDIIECPNNPTLFLIICGGLDESGPSYLRSFFSSLEYLHYDGVDVNPLIDVSD